MRALFRIGAFALLAVVLTALDTSPVDAAGRNLDGRVAPDMTFAAGGLNGVSPGTRLSSFRGKVVFVKFWLRDCPVCRRSLPRIQRLHERWGGRGLVVLTVIHKFRPDGVSAIMRKLGYDFPVASDLDGAQARRYGVGQRPTDYLIGPDGRVKASNNVSDQLIAQELGKYRLGRIDPIPASMKAARDEVWRGKVGAALAVAESASRTKGAGKDVVAAAGRIRALAEEDLKAAAAYATRLALRRKAGEARSEWARIRADYGKTSLATRATELENAFRKRFGGK